MSLLLMVLLYVTECVFTLPAPSRVFMESVDMRHVLKWRPLQAACSTAVQYSVQFQGEFELSVLNGSWVDAPECQLTSDPRCDLTFDLGSDSNYSLRVRACCGAATSAWTELGLPFNRRDTVLTAPEMSVTAVGDSLEVSFRKLPLNAAVQVTVWRRDHEVRGCGALDAGGAALAVGVWPAGGAVLRPGSDRPAGSAPERQHRQTLRLHHRSRRPLEEADGGVTERRLHGRLPARGLLVRRSLPSGSLQNVFP
ncbi:cytokine receptor family member B16 isoform X2 [Eleginops maclovinus]|uniref:cytokine receptor family member B16 isoform X2 n=1 Tax=Eleginops maclovinus TaxID=56733 RepID=UPI003080BA37